jgi:hypothetical protein
MSAYYQKTGSGFGVILKQLREKIFEMIEDGYRQEFVPELCNAGDKVRTL